MLATRLPPRIVTATRPRRPSRACACRYPVPVGSRVRATAPLGSVTDVPAGKQLTFGWVVEIEDQAKPACAAETVVLLLP